MLMMKAWLQRFIPAAQAPAALRIDPVGAARTEPDAPGRLHAALLTDGQSSIDVGFLAWWPK
jgi:hypothetical protein